MNATPRELEPGPGGVGAGVGAMGAVGAVGAALNSSWWRWPVLFGAWTLLAVSFAAQFYISSSQAGLPVAWRQALGGALGDWYVVAVLTWPVLWLERRCAFRRERWLRCAALHLLAAIAFSGAFILLRATVAEWQGWAAGRRIGFADLLRPLAIKTWHFNLIIYAVIAGAAQAIRFYRDSQERAVRALELEKRLAEARLSALQMQLNPHFLFNALNSIATLIHKDPESADRMLIRLAELLRMTLDNTTAQEIPLRSEVSMLERYLDIERIRFGDRLTVRLEIPDDVWPAQVPTLLLQPIVENALRHGLSRLARPGLVEIRARAGEGRLRLEVRDNGVGWPDRGPAREGIGLSNTRARLQHLYGNQHRLQLENHPDGGALVVVELPWRR